MKLFDSRQTRSRTAIRRGGFTLVEVLVAVAIMSLLFAVILVPIRLGFDTFHIGKARSEVQQQAQLTVQQIGSDLRRAQFVFPNSFIAGVSDNQDVASPCSSASYKAAMGFRPYVRTTANNASTTTSASTAAYPYGICDTSNMVAWDNPSRIDMLQVRRDRNGGPSNSTAGADFIITYYPRRLDITKPYDAIDNPVVLWRAQIAFRSRASDSNGDGPAEDYKPVVGTTNNSTGPFFNADINWTRYPNTIGSCTTIAGHVQTNRDFAWITHNFYGEANLAPLTGISPPATSVADAHTLATPRGMGLIVPRTNTNVAEGLMPELSFVQESINGKRIDRVTVNMTLAQFDQGGAASTNGQGVAQRVRVSQTFDLPSAGCSP